MANINIQIQHKRHERCIALLELIGRSASRVQAKREAHTNAFWRLVLTPSRTAYEYLIAQTAYARLVTAYTNELQKIITQADDRIAQPQTLKAA